MNVFLILLSLVITAFPKPRLFIFITCLFNSCLFQHVAALESIIYQFYFFPLFLCMLSHFGSISECFAVTLSDCCLRLPGRRGKPLQVRPLEPQTRVLPQLWRLDVQDEDVSGVGFQ